MLSVLDVPENRRVRAEYWIKVISEQADSSLSIKKYCQEQGINPSTFYYWSNYLKGKTSAPSTLIHQNNKSQKKKNLQELIALKVDPSKNTQSFVKQGVLCILQLPKGSIIQVYDGSVLSGLMRDLS